MSQNHVSYPNTDRIDSNVAASVDLIGRQRWTWHFILRKPTIGSRWWHGNFTLGICVDSHPRFLNVIVCFVFFEIGISWQKD